MNWLQVAQRIPVLFCMAFVLWAACSDLASMVIGYWLQTAHRPMLALFLFLLGLFISASCLWSLIVTVFRGPGFVELSDPGPPYDHGALERGKTGDDTSAIPLLAHNATVSSSNTSSDSSWLRSRSPSDGSIRGIKSQTSSRSPSDSLTSSRQASSHESDDSWQDTDDDDDDAPLSSLMRSASKEVGHLVDQAAPYVEAAGRLQIPDLYQWQAQQHQPHRRGASILAKANGAPRYCRKCDLPKPDRAHHCSTCERCVLQQDHHCGFIGTCVGHRNRKSFLLFLIYSCLMCIYSVLLSLFTIWDFLGREDAIMRWSEINWAIVFLVGAIFGVTMSCFAVFHVYLVVKNKTTIENMESTGIKLDLRPGHRLSWAEREDLRWAAQRHHPFDLGWRENLAVVFGGNGWLGAMLPIGRQPGDGLHFDVNRRKLERFREACHRITERAERT